MPAALNKAELLDRTHTEFTKLSKLLGDLPEPLRMAPDDDGATPKDIVGHRAHWIELFLGWYADGQAGVPVAFPAPGYKWNQLREYNADLRKAQATLDWYGARKMLDTNHHKLTDLIERLDDRDLYGGPMKGANNDWTSGRWAEAAGPSHYRSAAKYLRARIRAAKT